MRFLLKILLYISSYIFVILLAINSSIAYSDDVQPITYAYFTVSCDKVVLSINGLSGVDNKAYISLDNHLVTTKTITGAHADIDLPADNDLEYSANIEDSGNNYKFPVNNSSVNKPNNCNKPSSPADRNKAVTMSSSRSQNTKSSSNSKTATNTQSNLSNTSSASNSTADDNSCIEDKSGGVINYAVNNSSVLSNTQSLNLKINFTSFNQLCNPITIYAITYYVDKDNNIIKDKNRKKKIVNSYHVELSSSKYYEHNIDLSICSTKTLIYYSENSDNIKHPIQEIWNFDKPDGILVNTGYYKCYLDHNKQNNSTTLQYIVYSSSGVLVIYMGTMIIMKYNKRKKIKINDI